MPLSELHRRVATVALRVATRYCSPSAAMR
jgi:hypothetical protein